MLKKNNILIPKVQKTCIYSKKTKKNDSKKSPQLQKNKKHNRFRLYVGLAGIDEFVCDFFDFLSICRFGGFSLSFF